jgi:hypothetical protein
MLEYIKKAGSNCCLESGENCQSLQTAIFFCIESNMQVIAVKMLTLDKIIEVKINCFM